MRGERRKIARQTIEKVRVVRRRLGASALIACSSPGQLERIPSPFRVVHLSLLFTQTIRERLRWYFAMSFPSKSHSKLVPDFFLSYDRNRLSGVLDCFVHMSCRFDPSAVPLADEDDVKRTALQHSRKFPLSLANR
jgi:hypothetical protein